MVSSSKDTRFLIKNGYKLKSFYVKFKTRTQMQCTFHCKSSDEAGCVAFEYNKAEGTCRLSKDWPVKSDERNDLDAQVYRGRMELLPLHCIN